MNQIKVGLCGVSWDYKQSLIPKVIEKIAGRISWVPPEKADLVIIGPFDCDLNGYKRNYVPKFLRSSDEKKTYLDKIKGIKLFHTNENIRPDKVNADFSISFDHTPHNPKNFRFPYWMEIIDWSGEGIVGQENPRFGRLIKQEELLRPLELSRSQRQFKAAFFTSHLMEPKKEIYSFVNENITVDCYGAAFDKRIKNHSQSNFEKNEILNSYIFNLCPENSMYPGYNTEKIPEAIAAGCIPVTWTIPSENYDFSQDSYLNLADQGDIEFFNELCISKSISSDLKVFAHPLLKERVSLEKLVDFLKIVTKLAIN